MEKRSERVFNLHLTNTMSRKKELFRPRQDGVKMFTCGPSVYRKPHVGNYRTFLFEDVLQRYLEYLGFCVDRVINFTDVEDKSLAEAMAQGIALRNVTHPMEREFFEDSERLSIQLPAVIPRASDCVEEAVELIQRLLKGGNAYWYGPDVFFDPLTFPGFGKLFRLDMSRWPKEKRRYRKDTYPGERWNLGDFILWHGYREESPVYWETDIGRGRPAWNIQDPAIIAKHLGYEVDICCGGADNLYRHHDYTIAVMESLSKKDLARYWLHGQHLLVDGTKMSKSKGNIVYLEDLIRHGITPAQARFFLIYGHYGKRMNLTMPDVRNAAGRLDAFQERLRVLLGDVKSTSAPREPSAREEELLRAFEESMNDDLNVENAFDAVDHRVSRLLSLKESGELDGRELVSIRRALARINSVLQVLSL